MVTNISYIAIDGKQFDNKEECLKYEGVIFEHVDLKMYDANGILTNDLDEVYYVDIPDVLTYNKFKNLCDNVSGDGCFSSDDKKIGKYFYDDAYLQSGFYEMEFYTTEILKNTRYSKAKEFFNKMEKEQGEKT